MQMIKELAVCVMVAAMFMLVMLCLICESPADVVYLLTGVTL